VSIAFVDGATAPSDSAMSRSARARSPAIPEPG
jgi:hypothetical protein